MPQETIGEQEPRPVVDPVTGKEMPAQAPDRAPRRISLARWLTAGLIGGLSGMVAMDLTVLALSRTVGVPRSASLDTISDSVAVLSSKVGVNVPPGLAAAAVPHILISLGLGVVFGGGIGRTQALREASPTTTAGLGAVYALAATQPFLAAAAITLKMTRAEAVKWYGITLLTHTVFGSVLGAVAGYGLRSRR
jgi:hypothetical protein